MIPAVFFFRSIRIFILSLLLFSLECSFGQTVYPEITVDFNTAAVQSYIPFDVPFILKGSVPADVQKITCTMSVNGAAATREYVGKLIVPTTAGSTPQFSFLFDPVPPNVKVQLKFSFLKKVQSLDKFNKLVEQRLHDKIVSLVPNVYFSNNDINNLQTELKDAFNTQFGSYSTDFANTILDNTSWPSKRTVFDNMLVAYLAVFNDCHDLNANPVSLEASARTVRANIYLPAIQRLALAAKNNNVASHISKILITVDSDWEWLYMGMTRINASEVVIPSPAFFKIQPEMTSADARAGLARVTSTKNAIQEVNMYVAANVRGKNAAYRSLNNGTVPSATARAAIERELQYLTTALTDLTNRLVTPETKFKHIADNIDLVSTNMNNILSEFRFTLESKDILNASTDNTFEVRGSWYIAADLGIAYLPEVNQAAPYYGANIYFTPVNKNANYSLASLKATYGKNPGWVWFKKHACLTIGVTASSIKDDNRHVDDLWSGGKNLMVGGGLRLGRAFRVSYGGIVFKGKADSNPLTTETAARMSPFVSASVDLDLIKLFGKIGNLFP